MGGGPEKAQSKPPVLLVLCSRMILFGVVALLTMTVAMIIFPELAGTPYAYLGALLLIPIVAAVALVTFYSVDRRSLSATRALVWLHFAGAALLTFGAIANVGELVLSDEPVDIQFVVVLVAICSGLMGCLFASGVIFLRWQRQLEELRDDSAGPGGAGGPQ